VRATEQSPLPYDNRPSPRASFSQEGFESGINHFVITCSNNQRINDFPNHFRSVASSLLELFIACNTRESATATSNKQKLLVSFLTGPHTLTAPVVKPQPANRKFTSLSLRFTRRSQAKDLNAAKRRS